MRDIAVEAAGLLAIFVAAMHQILGETRVFARATIEPPWARRLLRLVWAASAIAWAGGGVLLLALPSFRSETARYWTILVMAVIFGFGAIGNAWVTRGRHLGWKLLTGVIILALAGL